MCIWKMGWWCIQVCHCVFNPIHHTLEMLRPLAAVACVTWGGGRVELGEGSVWGLALTFVFSEPNLLVSPR